MSKLLAQIAKFGAVGVVATAVDFCLLILLTEAFGLNYLVSATISFSVSVFVNYLASMRFVFARKKDISRTKEFAIFLTLSIVGLLINSACMWFGVEALSADYRIAKVLATIIVMAWNFISRKVFLEDSEKMP
jgi:putative flippase GtrA